MSKDSESEWPEFIRSSHTTSTSPAASAKKSSKSTNSTSTSQGHDYQFLKQPPREVMCSICLSVLRDPHLTSCCGQHFCSGCIKPIQSGVKRCPLCQERKFSSMLDKSVSRKVSELKMYCPNKSNGCDWTGELKNAEMHLERDCDYVLVTCQFCIIHVLRCRLHDHQITCSRRPVECVDCGQVDAWEVIMGIHRDECRIPCPNACGSEIKPHYVTEHLKSCPLVKIPCEFEFVGCLDQSCRKDVASHASECVSHHLTLVTKMFQKELARRDEEIESLKTVIKQLQNEITSHGALLARTSAPQSRLPTTLCMPKFECYVSRGRWFSEPFLSHPNGYKFCLCVCLNGTGIGAGTHLSVFANIMQGDNDDKLSWPFQGTVNVCLVAGRGKIFSKKMEFTRKTLPQATRRVISAPMNKFGQGLPRFVSLSELTDCRQLQFTVESVELNKY